MWQTDRQTDDHSIYHASCVQYVASDKLTQMLLVHLIKRKYLKSWLVMTLCATTCCILLTPRSAYIHCRWVLDGQQIDVFIWVGHAHIASSRQESRNKVRRSAQNHNCANNTNSVQLCSALSYRPEFRLSVRLYVCLYVCTSQVGTSYSQCSRKRV